MTAEALRRHVHGQAYERDLWRGAAARGPRAALAAMDDVALWLAFRDAWSLSDPAETVRIGGALLERGPLRASDRTRLRSALAMLGRAEQALDVDPGKAAAPEDLPSLMAAGRLAEARERLAGMDDGSGAEIRALAGRALGDCEASEVWSSERGGIAAALELGCGDLAADLAAQALGRSVPTAGRWADAPELLCAAFRLAGPDAAGRLLAALGPLFAPGDRRAFEAVPGLREGGPDDGPMMTAEAAEGPRFALAYLLACACAAVGRPDGAVRRLCSFHPLDLQHTDHLCELARLVSAAERQALRYAAPSGRRRVFDVFPFNGEFRLLDLKLAAMADWVDAFVLVEADQTFTGNPKPLYFHEARRRYGAYADKIVHVVADAPPPFVTSAWAREYHQRDQGIRGLSGLCAPDDLVLISDVDEIADPAVLEDFHHPFATLGMRTFRYFLNYERVGRDRQERKVGVVEARMMQGAGLSALRVGMWRYCKRRLPDGGWHFSSVLTPEDIELKVRSYSHEEHQPGAAAMYRRIEEIRAGYREPGFVRTPIDSGFPQVLQDRPEAFAEFILEEPLA